MLDKTGMNPRDVRAEIHRYLVQPGRASSYKMGHLKMLELREDAAWRPLRRARVPRRGAGQRRTAPAGA